MKYLLLFHGGEIPEDKIAKSVEDRLAWMNMLRDKGNFIDGSPLLPDGKEIGENGVNNFVHESNSVNGYAIIQAEDIDRAVELSRLAPQIKSKYGSATIEIRPLQPIG